jgi:hypothetical protein
MNIIIAAEVPEELVQEWLQHIRDFDIEHARKIEFRVVVHSPTKTVKEIRDMLNIKTP